MQRPSGHGPLDRILEQARRADRGGDLVAAAMLYQQVLLAEPAHRDGLFECGVLARRTGQLDAARQLLERCVAAAPRHAPAHHALAQLLQSQGRYVAAVRAYREALRTGADVVAVGTDLSACLADQGLLTEAEAVCRRVLDADPGAAGAWQALAAVLSRAGRRRESTLAAAKAFTLDARNTAATEAQVLAHLELGNRAEARSILTAWAAREPDNAIAKHLLAASGAAAVPPRASDAFVTATFDGFADTFDAHLQSLGYQAPALLLGALEAARGPASRSLAALDAGCGTGLLAPLLRPFCHTLVGVDLSAGMLGKARRRGGYDELVEAELGAFLDTRPATFDLIAAADTLVYFGDLEALWCGLARAMRPGGLVVATVERATEAGAKDYELRPTGRYAHTDVFLQRSCQSAGLRCDLRPVGQLRLQAGLPVAGLVVTAVRD